MPCKKCDSGKWKFGRTGKCKYNSKSECETDNADYYNDSSHDHHFNFTEEQMKELHKKGRLEVKVTDGDKDMVILFTYEKDDLHDLLNKSNSLTQKYKNRYGN